MIFHELRIMTWVTRYDGISTRLPSTRMWPWFTNWRAWRRVVARPRRRLRYQTTFPKETLVKTKDSAFDFVACTNKLRIVFTYTVSETKFLFFNQLQTKHSDNLEQLSGPCCPGACEFWRANSLPVPVVAKATSLCFPDGHITWHICPPDINNISVEIVT